MDHCGCLSQHLIQHLLLPVWKQGSGWNCSCRVRPGETKEPGAPVSHTEGKALRGGNPRQPTWLASTKPCPQPLATWLLWSAQRPRKWPLAPSQMWKLEASEAPNQGPSARSQHPGGREGRASWKSPSPGPPQHPPLP